MIEYMNVEQFKAQVFDYEKSQDFKFEGSEPLIVNFTAAWCGPCQMFAPVLEKIAQDYSGKLKILKVDIDANPELPALFGIRSVPTTVFLKRGDDPALASGALPEDSMQKAIQDLFQLTHPAS